MVCTDYQYHSGTNSGSKIILLGRGICKVWDVFRACLSDVEFDLFHLPWIIFHGFWWKNMDMYKYWIIYLEIPQILTIRFSHQLCISGKMGCISWPLPKQKKLATLPWERVLKPTYETKIIFLTFFKHDMGTYVPACKGIWLLDLLPTVDGSEIQLTTWDLPKTLPVNHGTYLPYINWIQLVTSRISGCYQHIPFSN